MLEAYLESRKNSLAPETLKTVRAILNRYGSSVIIKEGPELLIAKLEAQGISRYTQQTYMMYLGAYWKFVHAEVSPYSEYLKQNKQLFKNSYTRKKVNETFDEVKNALTSLPPTLEREACLRMLLSAQRASEAGLFRKDGTKNEQINEAVLTGKGGKVRANFSPIATHPVSYYHVYAFLKAQLGITPHVLRKLALTQAAENGATAADLCEIAGWSNIKTAFIYLQPKNTERLKGLIK